jgi:hypothetical protein
MITKKEETQKTQKRSNKKRLLHLLILYIFPFFYLAGRAGRCILLVPHIFHLLLHLPQAVLSYAGNFQNWEHESSDEPDDHSDDKSPKQNSE